ncbi:Endo-1,4-beta-xylanase Z [Neolewinella maritima]|uniref:Endo-1,4-beta-xylanase Z n=1 Tax=Neolewinella maritima TaxID=1383882 RepID=A0ABM9B1W5_9BACT|nr:alpha/beta hydrolase-fold protein [Neolewinella maritima]CAH1001354.1 Endo-1,4-beta-xylanase Z [Neolewinella maritima]
MLKYLCLLLALPLAAQTGQVNDRVTMQSDILGMERAYAVYLPPGYATDTRSYPVLYLLHGAGDDQTGWVQFGEVGHIADKAIREGTATPMIIIMPDANTGKRGYYNSIGGDFRYEDFFFEELMPEVESKYRIRGEKRYRAVAGLSMGGGGTLIYAMHHPELFSSAAPLSAWVGELTQDAYAERLQRNGDTFDEATMKAYFNRYSALAQVENGDAEQLGSVRWYIDCGDDDFLYEGNSRLHILLREKEVPHEYRVRDGAHSWTYWRESLPEVLGFVSQAFHQY